MWTTLAARVAFAAATLSIAVVTPGTTYGATYPTNTCVGDKLGAAATACQQLLKAWSNWEKDPSKDPGNTKRNATIASAGQKLASAWSKAEEKASNKDAECADTTVTNDATETAIASAVSNIVNSINVDVDFNDKTDRTCRAKLLNAAATACQQVLKAESTLVKGLAKDPGGAKRDASKSTALAKLTSTWSAAGCSVTTTPSAVAATIGSADNTAVVDTIVSPNVANTWTMITPDAQVKYNGKTLVPMCTDGSQYVFFVKRGSVNKLLVYYEGGGACWDYETCGVLHSETQTTGPAHNPALSPKGFLDLSNPANPFADWNMVFVPYCTGDVHWGNATVTYTDPASSKSVTIQHKGWVNAQVVEKWTREHFVNPDVLLVTGSSAGGYGALLNSLYFLQNVYQASKSYVVDDAGNGVITPEFQSTNLVQWGVTKTLPKFIPGLSLKQSISQVGTLAANFFPRTDFAQYTTAYDNTQSIFYNLMVKGDTAPDAFDWWLSACDWHSQMTALALQGAAGAPNYRYYIGAGSAHTIWGSNKVYTDTTGGVPLLVDWIDNMLSSDSAWTNVECTNCSLLPNDPPNPRVAPFAADGTVSCP